MTKRRCIEEGAVMHYERTPKGGIKITGSFKMSVEPEIKVIKCPNCGSDDLLAYGYVIGRAPILVKTMEVDESPDYCEPWGGIEDLDEFTCNICEFNFDDEGNEIT